MDSAASESRDMAPSATRTSLPNSRLVWDRIAGTQQFKHLIRVKRAFILPAFLVFAGYCLLMPLLTAYAPQLMASKVSGASVTYWYGISVILLAWVIVGLYVKAAARSDVLANDIVAEARRQARKSE